MSNKLNPQRYEFSYRNDFNDKYSAERDEDNDGDYVAYADVAEAIAYWNHTVVDTIAAPSDLSTQLREYAGNNSYSHNDYANTMRQAADEFDRLRTLLNTPELHDFAKGVVLEAAHQQERWGSSHDGGKEPSDWFWLIGYLGGKALKAHIDGNTEKALHHTISTAAALANWHAAILGKTNMRPGIEPPTIPSKE